ncbi:MAG: hypothetical protein V9G20_30075 [Candidatus Promineifilaceae bacterium]
MMVLTTAGSNCGSAKTQATPASAILPCSSRDALGAGQGIGRHGNRTGDGETKAALEILVGIVEDDERLVLDRRQPCVDVGSEMVEAGGLGGGVAGILRRVFGIGGRQACRRSA